jgi:diguanylate cyclase
MQPSLTTHQEDPAPPRPGLGFWGRAGVQRLAIKRLVQTWWTYGFAGGVLLLMAWSGSIPAWAAWGQLAFHWAGMAFFYTQIRSGASSQRPDPAMAFEQALFAVSAIVLSYALAPNTRGVALQMLCLALTFDMHRLSSRQLATAACSAVALLLLTLGLAWLVRPESFNLRREFFNLAMAMIQLPVLSLIGRDVRWLRQRQLQQRIDLHRALDQLHEASQRDALTGLFNRYHMGQLLEQELKRHARHGRPFSVAIIDIDLFKQINDQHGHAVGDAVLQTFAKLATAYLPKADALARWGGEEFLVLMPEQGLYQGMATMDGLRRHIAQFDWSPIAPGLQVHFSAGVTDHPRGPQAHLDGEDQIVARADVALYEAKRAGRNQVRSNPKEQAS